MRAVAKSLALLTLIALVLPAQSLVLACTRGRSSMRLPPLFHASFAAVLGLRVRYHGEALEGRGVVHASNHLSYLDVQALGQRLRTRFVAKEDVRAWPLFGLLARLQQPVFTPVASAPYAGITFQSPPTAYTGDGSIAYTFRSTGTKLRGHIGNGYRAPSLFERFGTAFDSFFGYSAAGDPRLSLSRPGSAAPRPGSAR